jgi:hypothetical protein
LKIKNRKGLTVVFVIVLIASISVGHTPSIADCNIPNRDQSEFVSSAVIWSDNFDDEDISDWTVHGMNNTAEPEETTYGNFSLTGGILRATGPEWNWAGHNSSVAHGTWSFDVDIQDDPGDDNHVTVNFISERYNDSWPIEAAIGDKYSLGFFINAVGVGGSVSLAVIDYPSIRSIGYWPTSNIIGWKHVVVTRSQAGQFYVYINGTPIIDVIDNTHDTSDVFYFISHSGSALDNVVVDNTVVYDKIPPDWDETPEDKYIEIGDSFRYDLNASDDSGIASWALNDVTHFNIDSQGVITNIANLDVGSYALEVSVFDGYGNNRTGTFTVYVSGPTSPILPPMDWILVAGGVGVLVIVILVIVVMKRVS